MVGADNIIGYSLMGASSGLATRLMQHWFPTPLERGQLDNIHENLAFARERLASEERRSVQEIEVRRELHLKTLLANEKSAQDQDLMRRWPLGVPAAAIVRASEASGSRGLNLIVVPVVRPSDIPDADAEKLLQYDLSHAVDSIEEESRVIFGSSVRCYREWVQPKTYLVGQPAHVHPIYPSGQGLTSTIHSLTRTEATILIQASFVDRQHLRVSWSCWGWAGDDGEPEPGNIVFTLPDQSGDRRKQMQSVITSIACALVDRCHLLRTPSNIPQPFFPHAIRRITPVNIRDEMHDGKYVDTRSLLASTYMKTLESLAERAPVFASEAAAQAALACHEASEFEFAEQFMSASLDFLGTALSSEARNEEIIVHKLMQRPRNASSPAVRLALESVRGLSRTPFINAGIEMKIEDLISQIEEADQIDPAVRKAMQEKLIQLVKYVPRIGVFGKAGVGKSSLCNALFGDDLCEVSDVEACTRNPQDVILEMGQDRRVVLVDVPGVGESPERDIEYRALYRSLVPELDVVLWVLKSDERAHSIDYEVYEKDVRPGLQGQVVTLFVLNHADKISPNAEWNKAENIPSVAQMKNLQLKKTITAEKFGVNGAQVVAVSAVTGFGLTELVDKMIRSLPPSKRISTAIVTKKEYVSPATVKQVENDVGRELNGAAVATGAAIGGAIGIVGGPIGVFIGAAVGAFFGSWFRK